MAATRFQPHGVWMAQRGYHGLEHRRPPGRQHPPPSRPPTSASETPSPNKTRKICMAIVVTALAVLVACHILSGQRTPSASSFAAPRPPLTAAADPASSSRPTEETALQRVCKVVWRLRTAQPSSPPELFAFLRLDPRRPPFHPPDMMAHEWRPAHRRARDEITQAWVTGLHDGGGGGMTMRTGGARGKQEEIAALKERIRGGGNRGGGGDFGLLHAVATVLWEDDTRGAYMDHVYPLMVSASKKKSAMAKLPKVCPVEG